jgi:hypothetical protein
MSDRTYEDHTVHRFPPKPGDVPVRYEEDERRAFPIIAAALGAALFLLIMLMVNWIC